jgi:hypothetical protein
LTLQRFCFCVALAPDLILRRWLDHQRFADPSRLADALGTQGAVQDAWGVSAAFGSPVMDPDRGSRSPFCRRMAAIGSRAMDLNFHHHHHPDTGGPVWPKKN